MADVYRRDPDSGSSALLGVILGVLLVVVLILGAWWLFFRQPVVVEQPDTTIIEEEQPATQPDVQPAPESDTNIEVNPDDGSGETSPAP